MKKLLLLICLFSFVLSYGQENPPQKINANYQFKAVGSDSAMRLPKRKTTTANLVDTGSLYYDKSDKKIHWMYDDVHDTTFENGSPSQSADNGVSVHSGNIVLGQDTTDHSHIGELISNRLIEQNSFNLRLVDSTVRSTESYLDLGDTIPTSPGTGYTPIVAHIGTQGGNWTFFKPDNYRQVYPTSRISGQTGQIAGAFSNSYATEFNGIGSEGSPDNVWNFAAYNENFNNGRTDVRDAGFRFAAETNFINSVGGTQWGFEFHVPEQTNFDGSIVRIMSYYTNKQTGGAHAVEYAIDHEYHTQLSGGTDYSWGDISGANGGLHGMFLQSFGAENFGEDGTISFTDPGGVTEELQVRGGQLSIFGVAQHDNAIVCPNNGTVVLNSSHDNTPAQTITVVGSDPTQTATGNSQLDVISKSKGFSPPRMSTTQKLAITVTSSDEGMMVYDLTLHKLSVYTGSAWETVTSL